MSSNRDNSISIASVEVYGLFWHLNLSDRQPDEPLAGTLRRAR
jgi:hypothetical protein